MALDYLKPASPSSSEEETSDSDSGETQKQEAEKALIALSQSTPKSQAPSTTANVNPKKSLIAPSQSAYKPQPPHVSSSSSSSSSELEESSSDTDSDVLPKKSTVADSNVKPITLKPMQPRVVRNLDSKSVKNNGSKIILTAPTTKRMRYVNKKLTVADTDSGQVGPRSSDSSDSDSDSDAPPKKLTVADRNTKLFSSSVGPISYDSSDSDSDVLPKKLTVPDQSIKPISLKATGPVEPVRESKSAKKHDSKPISMPSQSKSRPLSSTDDDSSTDEDSPLLQRMWSPREIAILEGMIRYKSEKNVENPIAVDMDEFHEFIKSSAHVDISGVQLFYRVRSLKRKYVDYASREKDVKDTSLSKSPQQIKGYELSKLIWGSNSGYNVNSAACLPKSKNGVDDDDKQKAAVEEAGKMMDSSWFVEYGGRNDWRFSLEETMKGGMELVDGCKRAEMEEKWKKLKEQELMVYVKRMELQREQALLVLEAIGSSGN